MAVVECFDTKFQRYGCDISTCFPFLPVCKLLLVQVSIQDDDEYITEEGGVPGEPPQEKRIR